MHARNSTTDGLPSTVIVSPSFRDSNRLASVWSKYARRYSVVSSSGSSNAQIAASQTPEFGIHNGEHFIESAPFPLRKAAQHHRNGSGILHVRTHEVYHGPSNADGTGAAKVTSA